MKIIKTALIIMGALILIGFVVVGYISYQRITGTGHFGKSRGELAPADLTDLAVLAALGLPNDARVEAIHDVGGARVMLLIRHPSFGDRLYTLDPRTGAVISVIAIGQAIPQAPGHGNAAAPVAAPVTAPPPAPAAPAAPPSPAPAAPASAAKPAPQPVSKPPR